MLLVPLVLATVPPPGTPPLGLSPHALALRNPPQPIPRTSGPARPPGNREQDMVVYGYHPYWEADPTLLPYDVLTHVAIFCVELESDGTLSSTSRWTDVAGDVVPLAHSYGVKVHLTVISFDDDVQAAVLNSPSRRATAVAELAALVNDYGADGVNIDIEGLDSDLSDELVSFTAEMNAAVDEVYLATPAVDWNGAFDYSALAENSDGLFIMGYGYHWTGGNPGPNDPLYGGDPWSAYSLEWSVDDYETYGALPTDIVLGLPSYGQEWPADHNVPGDASDGGWSVEMWSANEEAATMTRYFDEVTRSPYILPSGTQLWYPTNESIRERIAFARARGLQGIGFWALGYEGDDAAFWPMVWEETSSEPHTDDTGDSGAETAQDSPSDGDVPGGRVVSEGAGGCGCGTGTTGAGLWTVMSCLAALRRRGKTGQGVVHPPELLR